PDDPILRRSAIGSTAASRHSLHARPTHHARRILHAFGYHVEAAIPDIRLDTAMVLIMVTGARSMGLDALSRDLRRRLRIEDRPVRLSAGKAAGGGSGRACA
ncbi:MAG TPA: hypothetical protein VD970_10750, partial [Acetobacteraceae bacterium]|nr:hypothetical protein [Acetobacteraceae bacterium]